jgi:hypothetical protein
VGLSPISLSSSRVAQLSAVYLVASAGGKLRCLLIPGVLHSCSILSSKLRQSKAHRILAVWQVSAR